MNRTRKPCKPHVLPVIALLATAVLLMGGIWNGAAGSSPRRLRLKTEMSTVSESDRTRIFVEFLDDEYLPVVNDRAREVRFELLPLGSAGVGSGEIASPHITIPSGEWSSAVIDFAAQKPGRVSIRATSEGLESAQTLVTIVPPRPPPPAVRFRGPPTAPPQLKLKIYPEGVQRVLANGRSAATMWVTTDRPLNGGELLFIRVVTAPDANILAKAQEPGSAGFMDIIIGEGSAQSDAIQIPASRPGVVKVSAQAVPDGARDGVEVQFESPQPAEILLKDVPSILPSSRRKVPFTIRLADEKHVPLDTLQHNWHIQVGIDGDSDEATFDPDSVRLSPQQPSGQTILHLKKFPPDGQLRLLAHDVDQSISHTEKTIAVTSTLHKVLVIGLSEVTRGHSSSDLTLHLLDKDRRHVTADLLRKVIVRAERGVVNPSEVWIKPGQEHGHVRYVSPSTIGEDTITAESPGLEVGEWKIAAVTSAASMAMFAGLGGMIGSVIRQAFKGRVSCLLPGWTGGHLKPGLMGKALGGIVFGLVLFQSARLGVFPVSDWMGHGVSLATGSRMFAFLWGVLGGFGGVVVLERLLDRLILDRRHGKTPPTIAPAAPSRRLRIPRRSIRA
jgi:hypothetical protein